MTIELTRFSDRKVTEEQRQQENLRKLDGLDRALIEGMPIPAHKAGKGKFRLLTPGEIMRRSTEFDRVEERVYEGFQGKSVEEIVEIIRAAGISRRLISTLAERLQEQTSKKVDKSQGKIPLRT